MSDKKLASEVESMDPGALSRVNDFVDDDLLSCFMWAAGENAVAQPGWESPSQKPLKGIPLPPAMPPLPEAGGGAGEGLSKSTRGAAAAAAKMELEEEAALDSIEDLGDDDIADISKFHSGPMTKEQKLTQRMQRKAESARIARLRKKEYVGGLEEQVSKLQAEVARLREMQRAAPAAPAASLVGASPSKQEGQKQLSEMDALLKRPALDNLVPEVNASVEKYVARAILRNSGAHARKFSDACAIPAQLLRTSAQVSEAPSITSAGTSRTSASARRRSATTSTRSRTSSPPASRCSSPSSRRVWAPTRRARRSCWEDRFRRAPAARSSTAAAAPRRRR